MAKYSNPFSHFRENPWTAPLIPADEDSEYVYHTTLSRIPKPEQEHEDSFFAETLATPTTIPHVLTYIRRKRRTPPSQAPAQTSGKPSKRPSTAKPDLYCLIHLATPGISGHPNIAHGGVLSTLLDEVMGLCVQDLDRNLHSPPVGKDSPAEQDASTTEQGVFTANLDVSFVSPASLPADVIVRAWCDGYVGRKYFSRAEIVARDEQSGEEIVRAAGKAIWIKMKSTL